MGLKLEGKQGERMTRLAICVVIAVALVYAGEKLCAGKGYPLWEKYGPWLMENKVQAIAVAAAVLYGAWLALFPEGRPLVGEAVPEEEEDDGFSPC